MEIKEITMEALVKEIVPETSFGPQKVIQFARTALNEGKKFFCMNVGNIQYQVTRASLGSFFADLDAPTPAEPIATEEVKVAEKEKGKPIPTASTVSSRKSRTNRRHSKP